MRQLESEIDVLQIEKKISTRVKQQMEKNQREYYLNEQMKAIKQELGDREDGPNEQEELDSKDGKAGMHKEEKAKAVDELNKMTMKPQSRWEDGRRGKGCGRTGRSRWAQRNKKK